MKLIRSILNQCASLFYFCVMWTRGPLCTRLRYIIYRRKFEACGANVQVPVGCTIRGFANITLGNNASFGLYNGIYASLEKGKERLSNGDNVSLNNNVMINADFNGEIIIESDVIIGPNVVMRASNHKYERMDIPIREQGHISGKIVIK